MQNSGAELCGIDGTVPQLSSIATGIGMLQYMLQIVTNY